MFRHPAVLDKHAPGRNTVSCDGTILRFALRSALPVHAMPQLYHNVIQGRTDAAPNVRADTV